MNKQQKRYLSVDQGLIPVASNVVINALIAWLLFRNLDAVPMWGASSVMVDSLFTVFLLTAINAAIITAMVRRAVTKKPALVTSEKRSDNPWMRWWPEGIWMRSALLGLVATAVLMPLFLAIFWLFGITELAPLHMVAFKSVYVLALTVPLLPAVAWAAICDGSHQPLIER